MVNRKNYFTARLVGLVQKLLPLVDEVILAQAFADALAPAFKEGVGHSTADNYAIDLMYQILDDTYLVRNLCSAQYRNERPFGIL